MAQMTPWVPSLAPDVTVEPVGTDVLAFDGENLTRLCGSVAVVAGAIDGQRSVDAICHLVTRPTGNVEELLTEVNAALDQLVAHGLVTMRDGDDSRDLQRPDYVGWCEDGDGVVLVDLRTGERHVLDPVGARTWELLIRLGSVAAAIAHLASTYHDTPRLRGELSQFAAELVARGLLQQGRNKK